MLLRPIFRRYTAPLILVIAWLLAGLPAAQAMPSRQDNPASQCAEGVRLFKLGQEDEALPLLAKGFAGRAQVTTNLDDMGLCAVVLGQLYYAKDNIDSALEAYTAALAIFRQSGNRSGEGASLSNLALLYKSQRRYTQALDFYQQALVIMREIHARSGEGIILDNIAGIYQEQGDLEAALHNRQQALAIMREVGDHNGEGITLSNIASIYEEQQRHAEALGSYQQALVIMQEIGDRSNEAIILDNIAEVYEAEQNYQDALVNRQKALAILHELGDHKEEVVTLNNIGDLYSSQEEYDKALEAHQQALALAQATENRASAGRTLNFIGMVYYTQGLYTKALDALQQALTLARAVHNRFGEGSALINLAVIYDSQGRYALAMDTYQQALTIEQGLQNRGEESNALNGIGAAYAHQGQYTSALKYYQDALTIQREIGNREGEGITLSNLGQLYYYQEQYSQSLEAYQQALAIASEIGDRRGESIRLNSLGTFYNSQGQYEQAQVFAQQALTLSTKIGNRSGESASLNNLGISYYAQGEYAKALSAYQRALAIAREMSSRETEAVTLFHLGELFESQTQFTQALDTYQQAMTVLETLRGGAGSEQGRADFIAKYASLYTRATLLYHQQGQDEQAFLTSERGRARAFLDSLITGIIQLSDQDAQQLLTDEQEAYAVQEAAQAALDKARIATPLDTALVNDLEQQLDDAKQAHADALQAIEDRGSQLAALVPKRNSGVLDVAAARALLAPDTTLISFFVADDQTLAFVLTRDQFTTLALPVKQADLIAQISALRAFATTNEAIPASARQLYDELIAPLKPHLTTSHLAIIPHSVLHYLPFAALSDGQRSLLDDYTLSVLPSASSLPFIQQNATDRTITAPLILGNPASNEPDLKPLTAAEGEARAIAHLYTATPLLGADASEPALHAGARSAGIVHLAAHAAYNAVAPLSSAIYLAPEGAADPTDTSKDGKLEVGEIYGLDLHQTDLVVLSACETQLGDLSAGDELVGMTRAFFFAGTPSVIATLWSVDDQTTGDLMQRFYSHLRAGKSKAEALRLAQQEIRKDHPSPYYWAGFVLSGDPGKNTETPLWPWVAGGGLLALTLAGGGAALWRRRSMRRQMSLPPEAALGEEIQ